jgi:hypothetical protein
VSAVHVSSVRDAHDAHQNPVDVDRVDDAVLTPTRLPAARNRQAKRLAYPVRILGERALQEGDYGEGDGLGKVPFDRALGARGKNNLVPGLAHARRSASAARTASSCSPLVAGRLRREGAPASRRSSPRRCETRAAIPVARTRAPGVRALRSTADSDSASRCSPTKPVTRRLSCCAARASWRSSTARSPTRCASGTRPGPGR